MKPGFTLDGLIHLLNSAHATALQFTLLLGKVQMSDHKYWV